jgi:hypothetical protein
MRPYNRNGHPIYSFGQPLKITLHPSCSALCFKDCCCILLGINRLIGQMVYYSWVGSLPTFILSLWHMPYLHIVYGHIYFFPATLLMIGKLYFVSMILLMSHDRASTILNIKKQWSQPCPSLSCFYDCWHTLLGINQLTGHIAYCSWQSKYSFVLNGTT